MINTDKWIPFEKISAKVASLRRSNQTIAFTNGCFDILHAGHVDYLEQAAKLADILILGLNSDQSIRQIKGSKRPIIEQEHRIKVVSALACVDYVVLFDEPDPERLIVQIHPDVLIKGEDWAERDIIGGNFVKQHGGKVVRIPFETDISTTIIIDRIGHLYNG